MNEKGGVKEKIDHSRGLCHKPDMKGKEGKSISFEEFKANPLSCKCCGATLEAEDSLSTSFKQLGMYMVVCPVCPPSR